jgi:hypothetical protein
MGALHQHYFVLFSLFLHQHYFVQPLCLATCRYLRITPVQVAMAPKRKQLRSPAASCSGGDSQINPAEHDFDSAEQDLRRKIRCVVSRAATISVMLPMHTAHAPATCPVRSPEAVNFVRSVSTGCPVPRWRATWQPCAISCTSVCESRLQASQPRFSTVRSWLS